MDDRNDQDRNDLLGRGIRMDPLLPPMTSASDAPTPPPATRQHVPESALHGQGEGEGETPLVRPGGQGLSAAEVARLTQEADPGQQQAERALEQAEGREDTSES